MYLHDVTTRYRTLVHESSCQFNSVETSEDGGELLAEGGLGLFGVVEPLGETLEGSGGFICVCGLLAVLVARLDQLSLVVVPPHDL